MRTETLIDGLVADGAHARRTERRWLALLPVVVIAVEAAAVFASGAARPDLIIGAPAAVVVWRILGSAVIAAVAARLALGLREPTRAPETWPVFVAVLAVLLAGWLLDAAHPSPLALDARLRWEKGLHCVAVVGAGALPVMAAFVLLLRRGATVRPRAAATRAGLASAASGGLVWALACPIDDPIYISFWYALASGLILVASRAWLAEVVKLRPVCPVREAMRRRLLGG